MQNESPLEPRETSGKTWRIGKRQLSLSPAPLVMGILNLTPDSFSDGGWHLTELAGNTKGGWHLMDSVEAAVARAMQMQTDGAAIIDIGGESTRPYSEPVDAKEEIRRVLPVITRLANCLQIPISIDTSKASVAAAAIDAGAEIINDVTGLQGDPEMPALAARSNVGVCVMHMQGTPQTMQDNPVYSDVVAEIYGFLQQRLNFCINAGIRQEAVCLDPGIGFGKTHEHNLELLRQTRRFCDLPVPILIGHSRKGFIGKVLGDKTTDRTAATLAVSLAVAAAGADIIRVHDVKPTTDGLKLFRAVGAIP